MNPKPPMTRILIAEPDEGLRILLTEELLEEGYDVIPTRPERLRERLETERPDLVLMGLGDRDRLRREGLQTERLPLLVYGRSPLASTGDEVAREAGTATAELDLKEIKAKVRGLLGGWGPSRGSLAGVPSDPGRGLPRAQMRFDFDGGSRG
jgi:hypothetical protein